MDVLNKAHVISERRQAEREQSLWWNKLTISQKYAANSLSQFGYELRFVRDYDQSPLAVLCCNNSVATVNADGDIDSNPDIAIR